MKTSSIMAALAGTAFGHMAMSDPPALRYKDNPNAKGDVDTEAINPITLSDFPCHGDADLVGTDAGKAVADYKAGESYSVTISGGATHGGGSCQISLSYDKGKTFTVIQSIIGECPMSDGDQFDFTVPKDAPDGDDVILSWSWLNKIGNREFYQSCAVVSVSGGSGGGGGGAKSRREDSTSFDSRPEMFVANIVDGCSVAEGTDVLFPDPGPDVTENTKGTPPTGDDCGASAPEGGSGGDSGGDSGSGGDAGGDAGSSGGSDGSSPAPTSGGGEGGSESGGGGEQAPAPTGGDDGQYSPPAAPSSAPAGGAPSQAQSVPPPAPTTLEVIPIEDPSSHIDRPGGVFVTDSASGGGSGPTTIADAPSETGAPSGSAAESAPASETGAPSGSAAESAPAGETGSPEASAPADSGSDSGSAPAPTGGSDSGSDSPSGSSPSGAAPTGGASGGEGAQSGECSDEGAWNCIGGNQFQRCASGQWTDAMAMADGTSCEPGQGQSFAVAAAVAKKFRFRRF